MSEINFIAGSGDNQRSIKQPIAVKNTSSNSIYITFLYGSVFNQFILAGETHFLRGSEGLDVGTADVSGMSLANPGPFTRQIQPAPKTFAIKIKDEPGWHFEDVLEISGPFTVEHGSNSGSHILSPIEITFDGTDWTIPKNPRFETHNYEPEVGQLREAQIPVTGNSPNVTVQVGGASYSRPVVPNPSGGGGTAIIVFPIPPGWDGTVIVDDEVVYVGPGVTPLGWRIRGEDGKALDLTVRSLTEVNARNAVLMLASLAADTFDFQLTTADATGTGAIIPDPGQVIELYHDGIRRFRGHVTVPRLRTDGVDIRAEGPWWWMQRIPLSSDQVDSASSTRERPVFVFPTQDLRTSIITLIDRMIASGVPIIRGTVADMFAFPRVTLAEKSFAQAFADLMSICPDAVAHFDYANAPLPILKVSRRSEMTGETLTIGSDEVEVVDVWPRIDLEVASIKVGAAKRNTTTGATEYEEQTTGTPSAGKNQVIVISGPEIGDFLPADADNSFEIRTIAMPSGGTSWGTLDNTSPHTTASVSGAFADFILANDENLATLSREFGGAFSNHLFVSNGGNYRVGFVSSYFFRLLDKPNLIAREATSGMFVVRSTDPVPDWASSENGYRVIDATLVAHVRYSEVIGSAPAFFAEIARYAEDTHFGPEYPAGSNQYNAFFTARIPVKLIDASFSSLTTIYRAWAYDYIQPPAGLAAALLAAQNWTPYEGRIRTVADDVDGAQGLDKKYRLVHGFPAHSTMDALARGIKYEISRGRREVLLGAPSRVDFGTLANRFKRHPKDNIIYL